MFARLFAALLLLSPLSAAAQTASSAPRLGVDYVELQAPQPTWTPGKIEIAEVFGYTCGHCAKFQPMVNAWKKRLGADVRFAYVPGVFGGMWDNFARAHFAAEAMNVHARTHDAMFKALHVEHKIKTGELQEIADLYGTWGVNSATFLSTMNSFSINAKMSRAKQFAQRGGVTATPTLIVAGKYRVMTTPDRGLEGMMAAADFLVAKERAARAATPAAVAKAK